MRVAKFDRYDMVNNPGDDTAAFTIWFSGCTLRCENCQNPALWNKDFGTSYSCIDIINMIKRLCPRLGVRSVVLLGGEPLQQDKEELLFLCTALKEDGYKIWLYTGYSIDEIPDYIKQTIYTVKCGRYIEDLRQEGFPASSNQRVYRLIAGDLVDITNNFSGGSNE